MPVLRAAETAACGEAVVGTSAPGAALGEVGTGTGSKAASAGHARLDPAAAPSAGKSVRGFLDFDWSSGEARVSRTNGELSASGGSTWSAISTSPTGSETEPWLALSGAGGSLS